MGNITVIGRDDASELYQKQSKSQNNTGLVTVALGDLYPTNTGNISTFEADRIFFAFGDDGKYASGYLYSSWTGYNTPANTVILPTTFKVQETTGYDITGLTVSVPSSSSTLTGKLPKEWKNVFLVVSDGTGFTSGATLYTGTASGASWIWTGIDLDNGQYFSFATQIPPAPG